ncbi:hypothetical protein BWGOE8_32030 [Bacillus mycoides]|uniref:Uncharacterized protein n=1 Tax=Bacillus mycoides TaxID=1405 RepID=A0A1E8B5M5_BACMY|nr:hypothetical protein BWGOE8_32030 [Bacillus mycoides]OFD77621.1 hypothetical protein BWGOE9_32090 [Bacillus mycoides]OFD79021.1 hypothetical protein BWGOE10_32510 [Bacillus mycoides]
MKSVYSVEYEMAEVVFYKKVVAASFDDAKNQIRQQYLMCIFERFRF